MKSIHLCLLSLITIPAAYASPMPEIGSPVSEQSTCYTFEQGKKTGTMACTINRELIENTSIADKKAGLKTCGFASKNEGNANPTTLITTITAPNFNTIETYKKSVLCSDGDGWSIYKPMTAKYAGKTAKFSIINVRTGKSVSDEAAAESFHKYNTDKIKIAPSYVQCVTPAKSELSLCYTAPIEQYDY